MIAERLIAGWVLRGQLLALAVGLGVAALAEAVERARAVADTRALVLVVLLRVALLGRELSPVLLGAGLALALAWRRQTGELLSLAAAGFSPLRVIIVATISSGALGLALAGPLELAVPTLRDRLQELEAGQAGQRASVAGRWILTDAAAIHVGSVRDGALYDVTVVSLQASPPTHRFELDKLVAEPTGWRSEGLRVTPLGPQEAPAAGDPPLPKPEILTRLGRAAEPIELGIAELEALGHRGWRNLRLAGIFAGFFTALAVASSALRLRVGPALAVAAAGLSLAAWRAAELGLGAGAAPILALLLVPLASAWRPVVWENRA